MTAPSLCANDVMSALNDAQRRVPGLLVLFRDHCHGATWMIDAHHGQIHLDGRLTPAAAAAALTEAVDTLVTHHGRQGMWHPALRLVPHQRDELAARRQLA